MNCEILETLYLRSNGDIPCNDDAGESVLLGLIRARQAGWSASGHFNNHRYRHIRAALQRGEPPWPGVCARCAFFRPHEPYADALAARRIRKIQVEPSLACRLRCPACSNRWQVRARGEPLQLAPALFTRVLEALRDEGYRVDEIEYCGQGEPLLHPDFPGFVRRARELFPTARQRLITSGNFDFADATGGERIDEIMVSCDGAFADSYARYRVGGDLEVALRFLRDAAAARDRRGGAVIWKYILFEWNDSLAELTAARTLATEMGLDWLLFVYTHSAGRSRGYTAVNAPSFPVLGPRVTTNATPIHYQSGALAALQ